MKCPNCGSKLVLNKSSTTIWSGKGGYKHVTQAFHHRTMSLKKCPVKTVAIKFINPPEKGK